MGRLSASLLAFLLGAAAMVALSSCGGSDTSGLLPGATASEINSNLDKVQELVAKGDCAGAQGASEEVNGQIEALEGVDSRLKEALSEGASRLAEVVSTCEEVPNEEDEEAAAQEAEEDLRAEEEADEKKEKKEKPDKPKPGEEKEPKGPASEPPEPPGQEKKEEVIPPDEEEETGGTPSGGVGPGAAVEGE
jgi:outer membrane biosynthesis protein TonB